MKSFTLKHTAHNPFYFYYENITIKLSYVQDKRKFPSIEVFKTTKESLENEWHIYGGNDDVIESVSFQSKNEIKLILVEDIEYEIKFKSSTKEVYEYPKSTEVIDVYNFGISKIDYF